MHHSTITLDFKSPLCPYNGLFFPRNPRLKFSLFPPVYRSYSVFNLAIGAEISVPKLNPNSISDSKFVNGSVGDRAASSSSSRGVELKDIDVATLGNLCVDIVLNVPKLPPPKKDDRKAYMDRLAASPPDQQYWEAGGNCNMAIAAARLGLRCAAVGHVGSEIYGGFLLDVLRDEGIGMVGMSEDADLVDDAATASYETLLCWVLVDPLQRHGFCSRADFSKEPAFSWLSKLSGEAKTAIKRSKILFCNGYGFDELSPSIIVSAVDYAIEVGTAVFFDPGPRGRSLSAGTPEEQRALKHLLIMSNVLLLTSDEAETLTGIENPTLAGQQLLKQALRTKWVIIKMGPKGSILITESSICFAPTFKVDVVDTVGCGDSFVAAIAFGYINNLPMVNTLAIANAVGAATAMGCGAGRNVATLEKVLQLMKESNLNDDDTFWNELFSQDLDAEEVIILSKMVINGSNKRLHHVSIQNIVSELLPKLETATLKSRSFILKD